MKLFLEGEINMNGLMTKTELIKLFNKYLTI